MEDIVQILHTTQHLLQSNTELLERIVNQYGEIASKSEEKTEQYEVIHDFVMFSLTKATRTLNALDLLLTNAYCEDALILGRSAYECYLNAAFIMSNHDRVNDVVAAKVGVYFGSIEHPVSKRGNPLTHRIFHPETGEVVKYGVGTEELAANTHRRTDIKYHQILYSFFSEYAHVHMVASGAYRSEDGSRFQSEADYSGIFQAITLCTFVSWLNLDCALTYLATADLVTDEMKEQLSYGANHLKSLFKEMGYQEKIEEFGQYAIDRLAECQ